MDVDDEVEFVDDEPNFATVNDDFTLDSQYHSATPDLTMSTGSFEEEVDELADDVPMPLITEHPFTDQLQVHLPQIQGPPKELVEDDEDEDDEFAMLEAWLDKHTVV